jgi:hypothetical protein
LQNTQILKVCLLTKMPLVDPGNNPLGRYVEFSPSNKRSEVLAYAFDVNVVPPFFGVNENQKRCCSQAAPSVTVFRTLLEAASLRL